MSVLILTGGGTAGHVTPNLALLPQAKKYFDKIYYMGGSGIEKKLAQKAGISYLETTVIKFDRKNILSDLKIPYKLHQGVSEAKKIFRSVKPSVVFSKGGYAALPACLAAKSLSVPVICHESDYSLGLANKITSYFAVKTLTSFPETKGGTYVGNPVREDFLRSLPAPSFFLKLDKRLKTILVCGGSLGSVAINEAVYKTLPILLRKYNVVHICGQNGDLSVHGENYFQLPYTDDFAAVLQHCDYVVSRSGSNTLFEIASLGKPCLTIPLPKGTSRGDQILNARSFEKRGFCKVLPQENLSPETLIQGIDGLSAFPNNKLDVSKTNETIIKTLVSYL
ncbi:MAG: UDP-N-acetylglucosamine--N-acetylmuramyl-(pentapeptide) pyrophosphoryl-undecaprenol N-acetylglucosamine transferase [Clostridia bacterium]|nr:UDP-N-acetylglucosamine--N-acetylmuramyl-(pentapeptide) pyrophosphoryl-undecaprenol N-acetylglucosamine transferase [Clostridia bacterium]